MRSPGATAEKIIAELASLTHGVVTRSQLLAAGITKAEIQHRLRVGALIRVHPGVYRVGHRAPSVEARYMAAVLAGGEGAGISGRASAHLLRLVKGAAPEPEVTAPRKKLLHGVVTRQRELCWRDVTECRGIPTTTVPFTLVDLASVLDEADLARAFHEAVVKYGTAPGGVEDVLARRPKSPGLAKLRAVMYGKVRVTLSKLEERFLAVLAAENLPLPDTNRRVGTRYVDCRWEQPPLTVELDSYQYHQSRYAWEQDRLREREAHARGDHYRRYTYGDVIEDSRLMLQELRRLLPSLAPGDRMTITRREGTRYRRASATIAAKSSAR